jgi:hypothetical protein
VEWGYKRDLDGKWTWGRGGGGTESEADVEESSLRTRRTMSLNFKSTRIVFAVAKRVQ